MSDAQTVALRFMVGARTLATVRRRLVRVPLTLAEARAGDSPALPPLSADAQGFVVTSLPEVQCAALLGGGMLGIVRQRYTRFYVDLSLGFDAWLAGLSANTRQGLKRKAKRLGGAVRCYRTAAEMADFYPLARALSARTYQERLLGAGLPDDLAGLQRLAAADAVRAWLLLLEDRPVAYLCCSAVGDTLLYAHVGHDPDFAALSPGAVLQLAALRDLFAERRFAWFDFTEGEGQHKRQMASGGVACVDLLLLRPTLANRALVAALAGFDGGVALAKRAVRRLGGESVAKRLRRG
ncbi:Acetyltransferase (GNAT) domain-containing protein [Sphingomonas sp. NFR04]|uniref:GNAT family N-acetyltransferase n=1 Tax=Sphingomonas sp. NFR04 TaxID=1566283 RepID=UPI0008E642F6|nr:GNAT family N-acetyltransferase [Sphingomonas sp. NFR04]SFJ28584.1 Acetyltransferase (GNAT) domain-containing protein [Sphingomonas sp. NFR04]